MRVWLSPIPLAAAALVVLVALVILTVNDSPRTRTWARWLIALTVVAILALTLLGSATGTGVPNLIPGWTVNQQLADPNHPLGVFNVVGNVAVFVPLGWLLALVIRRRPILVAAEVGFGLSAVVEVLQSFTGRITDIDDVILNGSGAVLGACVAVLILAARSASRRARARGRAIGETQ
jgi:glycopeptide antibiotics resistance protein